MDLNKLVDWAKQQAVSLQINFWESERSFEISVFSAAPAEEYYEKKSISAENFIKNWEKNLNNNLKPNATKERG